MTSTMIILSSQRDEIEGKLKALYASFTPTDGIGFGKRVGDGTHIAVERITDVGKQEVLLTKLREIEKAQEKVIAGTYGVCEKCKNAIPTARLEFRPSATHCVTCA